MSIYKKQLKEFSKVEKHLLLELKDFVFGDTIGKGGFGEVKRAIHSKTGRECAIKTIYNDKLEGNKLRRYLGEIETMAKCKNPFLLPIVGFTNHTPYAIITEYMPNGSLDKFVRNKEGFQLSPTQLTAIAMGISYGMVHLHSLGIIHRDLKAANIMLDSRLLPKIGDFGIARFYEDEMTAKIGTPNYMAPELITSHSYDSKVDVYAFAMILYEMTQNIRPYKYLEMSEIFTQILDYGERPPFLKAINGPLKSLIQECWDETPSKRPSFASIYKRFYNNQVEFPGTRRKDIDMFKQYINKLENRHDIKDFMNIKSNCDDWSPKGKYVYNDEYSSDIYASGDEIKDQTKVLLNPNSPHFIRVLEASAKKVDEHSFLSFYRYIGPNIRMNIPHYALVSILSVCISIMKRNKALIPMFFSSKFFCQLPYMNKNISDQIIECFSFLFINYPGFLDKTYCKAVSCLFDIEPEKTLNLYSYYIKSILTITNPWPILDNLFSQQKKMLNNPNGHLYLSLFHYLMNQYPDYKRDRSAHVKGVFLLFTGSSILRNIIFAYRGLIKNFHDFSDLDRTRIAAHLKTPELTDVILSILIQMKKPFMNSQIYFSLLSICHKSKKPWIVFLHATQTDTGSEFLSSHLDWMDLHVKDPINVMKILLSLYQKEQIRHVLLSSSKFYQLLSDYSSSEDPIFNDSLAKIFRRSQISQHNFSKFASNGIILKYISTSLKSKNCTLIENGLLIFDTFSRVSYSKAYNFLSPSLIDLLSSSSYAKKALIVIASLSFFPEFCESIKNHDVIHTLSELQKYENYREISGTILANVNKTV